MLPIWNWRYAGIFLSRGWMEHCFRPLAFLESDYLSKLDLPMAVSVRA